tara:strand:+ start:13004 stop:13726 length:723 start_codon:yes stop_codon:yes gene_type:complete
MLKRIIGAITYTQRSMVRGQSFSHIRPIGPPIQQAYIFQMRGVDELVLLNVDNSGPQPELITKVLSKAGIPISIGGGIVDFSVAKELIYKGADKLIFSSTLFENIDLVEKISRNFGIQSIVFHVPIIFKEDAPFAEFNNFIIELDKLKEKVKKWPIGEIMITDKNNDGSQQGISDNLVKASKEIDLEMPIILGGGVKDHNCFKKAFKEINIAAVYSASAFAFTKLTSKSVWGSIDLNDIN